MRQLVDACNETAALSVYDPTRLQMMFAATVESSHPLRYAVELNRWAPVYAGASGLAIMAHLPSDERREIIARTRLKPITADTITEPAALERELERVRRLGYARTKGQRIAGAVGLAAPVRLGEGRVAGALALTIPQQRFDPSDEPELARLVVNFAQRVTERVGGVTAPQRRAKSAK
jgi:DNA-binding IclR family transcriptional regulator